MLSFLSISIAVVVAVSTVPTLAANCTDALTPKYAFPSVAQGYSAQLVATGLTKPRSILFDKNGHLLVVQQGDGVVSIKFNDNNGCISSSQVSRVINSQELNHGLALSTDGQTLFASSTEAAYSWPFDPASGNVSGKNKTIVSGMSNGDHTTRTLQLSQKQNLTLVISRGSDSNIDMATLNVSSGHSQIKSFVMDSVRRNSFDFNKDGSLLGWGLRNSVGVAEEPLTGGIYSVENSADDIQRDGKDIHTDNPGEEMNFHGYLNGTKVAQQGANYGYPTCFAAWNVDDIPNKGDLKVGDQFVSGTQNSTINDTFCASQRVSPRLTFQAHMAPLDLKFNASGTEAWIPFHGSW
ncbi:MAG: hypothetical protein M1812_001736 [Candelaria pacifica]|nr:MAG: hypothetical protein M1812_001736 [Candelaria pacifica]